MILEERDNERESQLERKTKREKVKERERQGRRERLRDKLTSFRKLTDDQAPEQMILQPEDHGLNCLTFGRSQVRINGKGRRTPS